MYSRTIASAYVLPTYFSIAWAAGPHDMQTVGFVQGDNQRDTISLLVSCLVTLSLCVYSAIHLNLPEKGERYHWMLWREAKWCTIGLFAPELVLYTAWRQFASAKQLCDEVGRAIDSAENHTEQRKMSETEKVLIALRLSYPIP